MCDSEDKKNFVSIVATLSSQLSHKLEAADDDDLNYQRAHLNNTSTDEFKTVNPLIKHGKKNTERLQYLTNTKIDDSEILIPVILHADLSMLSLNPTLQNLANNWKFLSFSWSWWSATQYQQNNTNYYTNL